MRLTNFAFVVAVLFSTSISSSLSFGQAKPAAPFAATRVSDAAAPQPAPPIAAPAVAVASHLLQPSLTTVQQTLAGLKVERWKRGSVRDEASADINSIQQDMQQHIPSLLQDADGAPGALSKSLPLARHVDALYDVLLRVVEASRMAAPDDQAGQLRDALASLSKARLALDDSMETTAGFQEKQLADLRVTVQKPAAPAGTPAPGATPQKAPAGQAPANGATQKPSAAKPNTATPQKPAPQN
jgi:hypothetical protein